VQNTVHLVARFKEQGEDVSIAARAAGTDMSGGPLSESVVLDFMRYFTRIGEIAPDHAVVEPGVYYRDFEKETDKLGVMLPSYPASKGLCAMGGIVANNSGGEKTLAYGKTEDYVQELRVVLANGDACVVRPVNREELERKMAQENFEGEIYRKMFRLLEDNYDEIKAAKPKVSKNSAGYFLWNVWDKNTFDLTKLIVGSQGTLALITEIRLKLVPKKKHSRLAVLFLKDLRAVGKITQDVLQFHPESFESYDDQTLKIATKFWPEILRLMLKTGMNPVKIAWDFLPDVFTVLLHGAPKLVMLVEIASDEERDVAERLQGVKKILEKYPVQVRITESAAESEKYWTIRHESFNLLRHKIKDRQTAPFIDDVVVRPEHLPEFLPRLNKILEPYPDQFIYTIAGHVGDGNFHLIPLVRLHDPETRKLIPKISEATYQLVAEFQGSITAEHNDGLVRTPYLRMMYPQKILDFFFETKKIFDPLGILNPRKKVGGEVAYAMEHIK
jgi:FAD/FMN-containing dehydrogenase